jgi:hypothetical protein
MTASTTPAPAGTNIGALTATRDARGLYFFGNELWEHQGASNNSYGFQMGPDGHGGLLVHQEVHVGDQASFDAGTTKNRSESCGTTEFALGQTMMWDFSFRVTALEGPLASSWGAVIAQVHQLDQTGDYGNSPPFELVLMPQKDGSISLMVGANYGEDPTKVCIYQWPITVPKFNPLLVHTVSLTLLFDPTLNGKGRIKIVLDGVTYSWTGRMGYAGRTNYAKFGWYDGGDSQIRAIEHWAMDLQ